MTTLASALLLGGCGSGLIGKAGTGPDEFAVVTRAPLSLPPDYGLRPPRPGAERPNEESTRDSARDKLLSNLNQRSGRAGPTAPTAPTGNLTSGETAFLKRAEALDVDPNIRVVLERESGRIKEDDSLVDKLVFWKDNVPAKTVVDPAAESKRLRDNAAVGASPTKGTTPTVTTK